MSCHAYRYFMKKRDLYLLNFVARITVSAMTANQKDITQYCCSVGALAGGMVLCYLNFLTQGDITNGVLGMMGMCLSYSGAIFGVSVWVRGKVTEVETFIDERKREIDRDIRRNRKNDENDQ